VTGLALPPPLDADDDDPQAAMTLAAASAAAAMPTALAAAVALTTLLRPATLLRAATRAKEVLIQGTPFNSDQIGRRSRLHQLSGQVTSRPRPDMTAWPYGKLGDVLTRRARRRAPDLAGPAAGMTAGRHDARMEPAPET